MFMKLKFKGGWRSEKEPLSWSGAVLGRWIITHPFRDSTCAPVAFVTILRHSFRPVEPEVFVNVFICTNFEGERGAKKNKIF